MAEKLTSISCSGISIVVTALCTPAAANPCSHQSVSYCFILRVLIHSKVVLLDSPVIAGFASVHFATTPFLQL